MPIPSALIFLFLLIISPLKAQTTLSQDPCSSQETPTYAQGSCTSCTWNGTSYSCKSCSLTGATTSSSSIDMSGCASCSVAVAADSANNATQYCADLKVELTLETKMAPSLATITNTTQSQIKTLVPLTYNFKIGGTEYHSDQVTSQQGQKITYFLGTAFVDAGYQFQNIKILWQPPGSTAPSSSISSNGQSITLVDNSSQAGGYVFLFELTNTNDTGISKGTIYRSPDPTIYNPPDTSSGGDG